MGSANASTEVENTVCKMLSSEFLLLILDLPVLISPFNESLLLIIIFRLLLWTMENRDALWIWYTQWRG